MSPNYGMIIKFRCDPALIDVLPRPQPAREALPVWLRKMPATAASPTHGVSVRTVKQCPPFVDAMQFGFVIPLPCDVHVDNETLTWDWALPVLSVDGHTRSPISFHVPAQLTGSPMHEPLRAVLKFNCFWTITVDSGWSLYATHPINRLDLPFRTLTGLVDSDAYNETGIFFPAMWVDPAFSGTIARGTPVAQCFPVRRQALELNFQGFTGDEAARYTAIGKAIQAEPGLYRKQHRARLRSGAGEPLAEPFDIEQEHTSAPGSQGLDDGTERV